MCIQLCDILNHISINVRKHVKLYSMILNKQKPNNKHGV